MTTLEPGAFSRITAIDTLAAAHKKALPGKRSSQAATSINYRLMSELLVLQRELEIGIYTPRPYRRRIIREPKVRSIQAPAFRDRIVHHAVHSVLSPFYERHFINGSYACRPGKGTHRAVKRVQSFLRRSDTQFACKIDISKYYGSINHEKLLAIIARRVNDPQLLALLASIIASSDSGTEYDDLFAPDSHFHTKGRRGIPIGNLTSQLFANIYLHELDLYIKQTLKIRPYIRYMDDILFFHHDKAVLWKWQQEIIRFLYDELYLTVNPHKVRIYPTRVGVDFVGYVIWPHRIRLRTSSVRRFRKKFRRTLQRHIAGNCSKETVLEQLSAWTAHANHADSAALVASLREQTASAGFVAACLRAHRQQLRAQEKQARRDPPDGTQLSLF